MTNQCMMHTFLAKQYPQRPSFGPWLCMIVVFLDEMKADIGNFPPQEECSVEPIYTMVE
jgi:hypothetical protein